MNPDLSKTTLALAAGLALVAAGCGEAGDDDVSAAAANVEEAAGDYEEAAEEYGDKAADELEAAQDDLAEAAEQMRQESQIALDQLEGPELAEQVRVRLGSAQTAIENGNFDEAESIIAEVEAVQAQLPEAVSTQIASVKELLAKGQSAEDSAAKVRELSGGLESGE